MFKVIRKILRSLVEYPLWAYGLECSVCKMTLINPEEHYKHVIQEGLIKKHEKKITKL